jgi:hypothetical protein
MEFLVTGQTILCQSQAHLGFGLIFRKKYVQALALFTNDPGRSKKLLEPENKGAEPVLQGSIALECVLFLPKMGQKTTVVMIEILTGKITHRITELPCTVVAVGVAGSTNGAGKAPFDSGGVDNIAAFTGSHMVSARTMTHLTTHTFFDIGVLVWVIACQMATGAVILP